MDNPFERQFGPSYFHQQGKQQGRRRSTSTASEHSIVSAHSYSSELESQFILSMGNTPVAENPPPRLVKRHGTSAPFGPDGQVPSDHRLVPETISNNVQRPTTRSAASEHLSEAIRRSQPITIDLPPRRRVHTAPDKDHKAPEHLSARGDIPGGFFPANGDEQMQFYRPHPFHEDTQRARELSISQAAAECTDSPEENSEPGAMLDPVDRLVPGDLGGSSSAQPDVPGSSSSIASYNPLGDHISPIPTGKYYPTNWENRKKAKSQATKARPPVSAPATVRTEAEMPKYRPPADPSELRLDPNETPKTRLQQYQREMVMHASFAANALVRGKASVVAAQSSSTGSSSSLDLVALAHMQFGKHKPVSPRLHPLGSPGPVTPMDLESNKTDYLAARPADSGRETEIAIALRAEEERRKREGASSPMGQVKM